MSRVFFLQRIYKVSDYRDAARNDEGKSGEKKPPVGCGGGFVHHGQAGFELGYNERHQNCRAEICAAIAGATTASEVPSTASR